MKNINKTFVAFTLVAAMALPTFAAAATTIQSWLRPNYQRDHQVFIGRGEHTIDVQGDGSGDLDLYVYDSHGNFIAKDELYDDNPQVDIDVFRSGTFTLRVVNHGDYSDSYELTVD